MKIRSTALLVAAALAAPLAAVMPAQAQAQPGVVVRIGTPPPPPRAEIVPAPRAGYAWAPGHWEWRRTRHVWVAGHWVRERRGYAYVPPAWQQANGQWVYAPGRWDRRHDRDGDGVPNRYDARPNNPALR